MRILHLHENADIRGGSEVYVYSLIPLLEELGHESTLLVPRRSKKDRFQYSLFTSDTNGIERYQPDVIHIHGLNAPKLIRWCLDRWPVIRMMHEPRLVCPGAGKFLYNSSRPCEGAFGWHCLLNAYTEKCVGTRRPSRVIRALRNTRFEVDFAAKEYQRIVVTSAFMEQTAIEGGIPPERLALVPYFAESLPEYSPWQGEQRSCLFVGRLSPTKGADLLIEACLPLFDKYSDFHLGIVGSGVMEAELQSRYASLVSKGQVRFHGWKTADEIAAFMQSSYMVAFPSIYPEAFGIVGIEAMHHSRPVVGFDSGGVSDWLKNDETGVLVPPKDVRALQDGIESLLVDRVKHERLCREAYQQANTHYTEQVHLKRLLSIYQEAAALEAQDFPCVLPS